MTNSPKRLRPTILRLLGPGLVAGAADDDPSGIATYSQAGAQFGYGLLWTVVLTYPFMVAIQLVSARIGRATGLGHRGQCAHALPALGGACGSSSCCSRPTPSTSPPTSPPWARPSSW